VQPTADDALNEPSGQPTSSEIVALLRAPDAGGLSASFSPRFLAARMPFRGRRGHRAGLTVSRRRLWVL